MLRAVGPISETILLVDPGRKLTLVAVVLGYFDGSWNRGIVAVGGYISPADAWDVQFAPAWRKMLADPTRPGSRVQEFKASDCRTGYGEFSGANGWTQADRSRLMIRAVKVITTDTPLENTVGLGAAIEHPPINNRKAQLEYQKLAFYMCFEQVVQNALQITKLHLPHSDDAVQFVFDEQEGYEGVMCEQFERVRANVAVGLRHWLPPPKFGSSLDFHGTGNR